MAKKTKSKKSSVRVRDMKPKKDAKGGYKVHLLGSSLSSSSGSKLNKVNF
jgi:hypothetical protein